MDERTQHFLSRLRELATSRVIGPIDPVIDPALAQARPRRAQFELLRFRDRGSKLVVAAHGGSVPVLEAREGFELRATPSSVTLTRDDEYVLIIPSESTLEWHAEVPTIEGSDVDAFLASFAPLSPFEAIAGAPAFVRRIGIELDDESSMRALLAVDLAPGRIDDDEAALSSRGFRASPDDDAIWIDGAGRSLVWMGGTVYGYVGEVPERVGGW